ncbi:MlaD family protein [Actinomadura parmotrematis]|uniref:MlaD family protein n=1 Tax=Actinomadura parmotrematis TaxID=2864039 RepID=A0ABS7G1U2_9ACTN|nr:MlaD family protein [Actinomadura parmotrematis]MBW8486673.1 MlaD family protein [Actinomadura parmotrematis]
MSDETLSSRSRTMFGLFGAGVIAAAAAAVAISSTPSHAGSTYLNASFSRAGQGLDPGKSDVKIRGITVGTVDKIELQRDGRVDVVLRVDKGVKVARTASATVEPVSVFGPKDVALDLGAGELTGPYLPDRGTIARTKDPEDLSGTAWPTYRLTKAINPDELSAIVRTFGAGLSGEGPALRRVVDNGATVIDATHADRAELARIIANIEGLSGTLGDRGGTLGQTVRDFNGLAPVIYDRPDKVSQLLTQGGRLADTVGTQLQAHGDNLGSIIDGGGKAVHVVATRSDRLPQLVDGLNGFFNLLADIIRTPGPQGTMIAQARDVLPLDLCQTLIDACTPAPSTTAFDLTTTGKASQPTSQKGKP